MKALKFAGSFYPEVGSLYIRLREGTVADHVKAFSGGIEGVYDKDGNLIALDIAAEKVWNKDFEEYLLECDSSSRKTLGPS